MSLDEVLELARAVLFDDVFVLSFVCSRVLFKCLAEILGG